MANQWIFKSESYDNCNCSVSYGCQFNEPTTHGNCQFAYVGTIVEGHFNGTPLAGMNWRCFAFPRRNSGGKRQAPDHYRRAGGRGSADCSRNDYLGRGMRVTQQSFLRFRFLMLGVFRDTVPADRSRGEPQAQNREGGHPKCHEECR